MVYPKREKEENKRRNIYIYINMRKKKYISSSCSSPPLFLIRLQFSRSVRYHSDPGQFVSLASLGENEKNQTGTPGIFYKNRSYPFIGGRPNISIYGLCRLLSRTSLNMNLMHFRVYFYILPRADHYKRYYQ